MKRFLFLIIGTVFMQAQSIAQHMVAQGVIFGKGSQSRISGARITNLRLGVAVLSNNLGAFSIVANMGDTLQVSKDDFMPARMVVVSEKALPIYLQQSRVTVLDQVNVYGDSRLRDLKETQKDYKRQGSFYGGKPPVLSVIFSPLTGLYELFGKTPRNARQFGKYYNSQVQQTDIDNKFSRYLVEKYTPLRGDEVGVFMFRYRPDYNTAKNWNVYQSVDYIQKKYKQYEQEKASGVDTSLPDLNQIKPD